MKKTIWFFIRDLRVGGAEKLSISLAKAVDRDLYIPVIITLDDTGDLRSEIPEDIPILNLHGAQGNALQFPWRTYRYARRLRALISRERPHLVVTTNWFAGIVASLAISAIHDVGASLILEIHVPLRHFLKRSSFWNSFSLIKKWVTSFLFSRADAIVVVSSSLADDVQKHLGIDLEKISTIRNGIDVASILSAASCDLTMTVPSPYFVAVGRLEPEKGHENLLRAFAKVSGTIPHHLVIVGGGSEGVALEQLAISLNIQERVVFTGMLNNPYPVMAQADFLVLPSLWEAYPLVLLEAQVLRLPTLSTKTEGALEILQNGRCGCLVPVGDDNCLGREIAVYSVDVAHRERYVWRGELKELSLARMVQEYELLFSQVLL